MRSEGVEAELTGRLASNLELTGGYTYNTTEYLRDREPTGEASGNEGQPFSTFTPEHIVRLWVNYRLPRAWHNLSIGTGVTAQSSQYNTNHVVEIHHGGYALWNTRLSYELGARWALSLHINNLLDDVYYRALGNVNYGTHYGAPRSFALRLRFR